MKKIVKITIDNYKAYIEKQSVNLPNGENLLIYGENGSGKSSLFKAMRHFLQSSVDSSKFFDKNVFSPRNDGSIELLFKDYDEKERCILEGTEMTCLSCKNPAMSTNSHSFIKLGHRLSGFLDYSQLLKVYLNNGNQPNLFELINELIGGLIPISYGYSRTIKKTLEYIQHSMSQSYRRKDKSYISAKNEFKKFQTDYVNIIKDLDARFSSLMTRYFPDFNIEMHLVDIRIDINEKGRIRDTKIEGCIHIEVKHHELILKEYNARLNEARLSAIAICLYLASLQMMNQNAELKLLYLDDIFVGLDSANRRPIMRIIEHEFSDYQIIISTYDKSWYILVRDILNHSDRWRFVEFYEGEITLDGKTVVKPIIIDGDTNIDKAKRYLFNYDKPDYAASANYMRKAFEELLTKKIYQPFIKDDDLEDIPGYKVATLISDTKECLKRLEHDPYAADIIELLDQLNSYLRPMLHPLSHYAPGEPVYKQELKRALEIYERISAALETANYESRLIPIVTRKCKFMFVIEGEKWKQEYLMQTYFDMYVYEDASGKKLLSSCPFHAVKVLETDKTTGIDDHIDIKNTTKIKQHFEYNSIDDCISKVTAHLKSDREKKHDCKVLTPVSDMFFLPDKDEVDGRVKFIKKLTEYL